MIDKNREENFSGECSIGRDELRKSMKALRAQYCAEHSERLSEWSRQIEARVLALPELLRARRVMCYYSLSGEVQTASLLRALIGMGKEVYLPVTKKNRQMNAVRLRNADAVHAGAFRVMEPDGNEVIDPAQIDLVLVPGLAFDRAGGRIGYGAGCYDRFLPACGGVFAALSFEFQLSERVPVQAHDVPMHYVITEQAVYRCTRK